MTNKMYTVVGITDLHGQTKIRFTNDIVRRVKRLSKYGAKRLDFIDLPEPMTKIDALHYMLTRKEFQSAEDQATIEYTLEDKIKDKERVEALQRRIAAGTVRKRGPRKLKISASDILSAIA